MRFGSVVLAFAMLTAGLRASAQTPPTLLEDEQALGFFERTIRPLLADNCYRCHSASAERLEGGLRLDLRSGWALGGRSGPAIVPGEPEASLLIHAIRREDPERAMPPKRPLAPEQVESLERWVAMGAPDPRSASAQLAAASAGPGGGHWAFRPIAKREVPSDEADDWSRNEIDRFVLARLRTAGLRPAPEADRRTLLRRASFDLLGLPPSAAETEAFESDAAPDAYERLIDRLLASPHYGERWARHWLDVARYADSNGSGANLAMAYAWEYRDWVVRALNSDMPFDRFLTLQLAGDLLPEHGPETAPESEPERFDAWIATAFLILGPKDLHEVDKAKLAMDIVDEQIAAVSNGFLGLTLECARCHDHKFDPLTTEDYYALAGILKSTSSMERMAPTSIWRERQIATAEEVAAREGWQRSVADLEAELDTQRARASGEIAERWRGQLASYLLAGQQALDHALFIEAESFERSNLSVDRDRFGDASAAIVRTTSPGLQYAEYEFSVPSARSARLHARFATAQPRPVRVLLNGALVREDGLGETTAGWDTASQAWFEVATLELRAGANLLRLERDDGVPHVDKLLIASPESFTTGGPAGLAPEIVRNWAGVLDQTIRTGRPLFAPWHRAVRRLRGDSPLERVAEDEREPDFVALDVASQVEAPAPASLEELSIRYQDALLAADAGSGEAGASTNGGVTASTSEVLAVLRGASGPFALPQLQMEPYFESATREALARLRFQLAELRAREVRLRRTLAAAEGEVVDLPVHIRGSHLDLAAAPTHRGFPALFADAVPAPPIPEGSSGRLQLARWLTHPDHPLTSRVIANRVWQWHFGRGLVGSASNFGLRGESPTHPELLDWLADRLARDAWSLKSLHRRILVSSTYRMSSSYDPGSAEADPENRLLWRQNRRRLEAEPLRDALLSAAGQLDLTFGGASAALSNQEEVTGTEAPQPVAYSSPRRSLYLPVLRGAVYDFFASFDYRDASVPIESRPATVTVQQALTFMNSSLVVETSAAIAARVLSAGEAKDDEGRIERLYAIVLGRPPEPRERDRARDFVGGLTGELRRSGSDAPAARLRAWRGLTQVLLSSSEFLYVD